MKTTNLHLSRNNHRFTWEADGKECEFVNTIPVTFGEAQNFVDQLTDEEMEEFYVTPSALRTTDNAYSETNN